ncbi:MAG: hypothetical protein KF718_32885 [Polyangiaceae bacterium]|nr:hypothetical protein [Polyangiaceae bacterium]
MGLTYGMAEVPTAIGDVDYSGVGWHVSVGAGIGGAVSDSVGLFGGLLWHRQQAKRTAEETVGGANVEAEFTGTACRFLLTAGVEFF